MTRSAARDGAPLATWAFALVGGLCAWFVRLVVGVGMVGWACTAGATGRAALLVLMAVCAAVAGAAAWTAWRLRGRSASLGFVAVVGLMLNAVALAGIVLESVAVLVVDPCLSAT